MILHVTYVRVPYWRTLRPRWLWIGFGFLAGLTTGVIL